MYCSVDDINSIVPASTLVQLTDDTNGNTLNEAIVTQAIQFASDEIDLYLGGLYTVPLATVPDIIKRLCIDLTTYNLYTRRFGFELQMPESMLQRRKEILRQLEQIQSGKLDLGIDTATSPGQGYYKTNKTKWSRVFSQHRLREF